ncbi:hypothetical protein ACQPW1_01095 [Nocardia sp. CA-128927]|uniref:hypothetical protein n=1 Tax=Nocardia sp. CA-128927 TaxID=3239975 RepID=UPI003D985AF7
MGYPQYPGGYNPYPAYATGMSAPSGATAITAGVLACVGSVGELFGGGISLAFGLIGWELDDYDTTGLLSEDWFQTWAIVSGAIALVAAIVLAVGAVAMFSRKTFGRLLVVVGCVAVIVSDGVGFALTRSHDSSSDSYGALTGGVGGLLGLIFPVATAILALLPMTSRWLAHTPVAAVPQQYGYPYPGPQPGQPWPPMQPGVAAPVDGQPPAWGPPGQWQQPAAAVPTAEADKQSAAPQTAWAQPGPSWQPGQAGPAPAAQVDGSQPNSVPQAVWGQPGQAWQQPGQAGGSVPAAQASWQQPPASAQGNGPQPNSAPQAAWGQPDQGWQQPGQAPGAAQASWQQPSAPQAASGTSAQSGQAWQISGAAGTTDEFNGQSAAPQAAWGTPVQHGPSPDPIAGQSFVPQGAWGAPAQPGAAAPNGQVAWPPSEPQAGDAPAPPAIGRNDETLLRPPSSAPPSEPQVGAASAPPAIGRNDETLLRPPSSAPPSDPAAPPQPADDTVWRQPPV